MPDSIDANLDELDLAILMHLQEDGRKSFTENAKRLEMAVGAYETS